MACFSEHDRVLENFVWMLMPEVQAWEATLSDWLEPFLEALGAGFPAGAVRTDRAQERSAAADARRGASPAHRQGRGSGGGDDGPPPQPTIPAVRQAILAKIRGTASLRCPCCRSRFIQNRREQNCQRRVRAARPRGPTGTWRPAPRPASRSCKGRPRPHGRTGG